MDPEKLELIKDAKAKKVKGCPYTAVVKVRTTAVIKNFKNEAYRKTLGQNAVDEQITLLDCLNKLKTPEMISED